MASESESETSFLEHLISTRNRDLSILFPLLLGIMGSPRRDQETPNQEHQDRIILINPFTQGMIVVEGSRSFDALLQEISDMEAAHKGPPPASKASIDAMERVQVSEEGEECAICLEGMEIDAREMPCKHRYHSNCIEKWLGIHGSCPVCRYNMPLEEEEEGKKGESGGSDGNEGGRRRREIWVSFSMNRRDSSTETSPSGVGDRVSED